MRSAARRILEPPFQYFLASPRVVPLGYLGNYALFRLLRQDNALVNELASHYVAQDGAVVDPDLHDPNGRTINIVTPADAVHVESLPGTHSLLEPFKLRHRELDVEKARQEVIGAQLENLRRLLLLANDNYGDSRRPAGAARTRSRAVRWSSPRSVELGEMTMGLDVSRRSARRSRRRSGRTSGRTRRR